MPVGLAHQMLPAGAFALSTPCPCGRRGCASGMFEPSVLSALYHAAGGESDPTTLGGLVDLHNLGDSAALVVLEELCLHASELVATLALLHELRCVVLTGMPGLLTEDERQVLRQRILARLPGAFAEEVQLLFLQHTRQAWVIGGAWHAILRAGDTY